MSATRTEPTLPEDVPLKMAKFPADVEALRDVLEAMWSNWNQDEVLWLAGMLMDAIGNGEFADDDEPDTDEVPA